MTSPSNDNYLKMAEIMLKAKNNPVLLRKLILDSDFTIAWMVVMMVVMEMEVRDFHLKLLKNQLSAKKTLSIAGRGFGKSVGLNTAFVLTTILRNPNVSIAVATKSTNQASDFIKELESYLVSEIIKGAFGDLKGDVWNKTSLTLKNRTIICKEDTVTATATTQDTGFISKHFDIIILDDLVGVDNSRTKGARDNLLSFLNTAILPATKSDSRIHCIGTHYHFDDLWVHLERTGQYKVCKVPSLKTVKVIRDGQVHNKEISIWEEKFPTKELLKKREELGTIFFDMQYQAKVQKKSGGLFKNEWLKFYKELPENDYLTYISVDPAISLKSTADNFALTVARYNSAGEMFIVDGFIGHLTFENQINTIIYYYEKYPETARIGIEAVAYQQALAQTIGSRGLPVSVLGTGKKKGKDIRFQIFTSMWENGKVYINQNLPGVDVLIDEMMEFPGGAHDDYIDSVCMNWETYKKYIKSLKFAYQPVMISS